MQAAIEEERCPSGVFISRTSSHASARSSPTITSRLWSELVMMVVVPALMLLAVVVGLAQMLLRIDVGLLAMLGLSMAVLVLLLVTIDAVLLFEFVMMLDVFVLLLLRMDVRFVLALLMIVERASVRSSWTWLRRSYEASDLAPPASPAHQERTAKIPWAMSS